MNRLQIIKSAKGPHPEPPKDMTETDELAWALSRVLDWPNPNGRIGDYYLPGWLSEIANQALMRYLSQPTSDSATGDAPNNTEKAMEWQPIETAPRDGTVIWVDCADGVSRYGGPWGGPTTPPGVCLAYWDGYRDVQGGQPEPLGWVMARVINPSFPAQPVARINPVRWAQVTT